MKIRNTRPETVQEQASETTARNRRSVYRRDNSEDVLGSPFTGKYLRRRVYCPVPLETQVIRTVLVSLQFPSPSLSVRQEGLSE